MKMELGKHLSKMHLKTVMISPTDTCNLRCQMCWRLDKDTDPNTLKKELTFDEIVSILEDAKELGVENIDLTGGGEAFLRKDIFEVIQKVKEFGFRCSLTTNAMLLDEKKINRLIDLGMDDLCFSIESLDERINDNLRGKGTLSASLNAIRLIKKLRKKYDIPIMRIATVITNKNYKYLKSLAKFTVDEGISAINFSVLLEWDSNRHLSMKNEDADDVKHALEEIKSLTEGMVHTNLKSILKHGLFEHDTPDFCFAPWDMIFINSSGEVLACCILASFYENVIGNIKKKRLKEIFSGEKMLAFRRRLKAGKFYKECNRCLPEFVDMFNERYRGLK